MFMHFGVRGARQPPFSLNVLLPVWTVFSSGVLLLAAPCYASGGSDTPDPLQIARDASFNELRSHSQAHLFRYRAHKVDDDGKSTTREVIETEDGDIVRLLQKNDKPLTSEENQAELDRLNRLRDDPAEMERRHKKALADDARGNEMVKLLPQAFIYTYAGMEPGPNGPCYRLQFKPNPAFQPPDREAEVYHGMAGELWIDQAQKRMVRFDAHLISDVDFGWGVVGKLFKGGTASVEQRDVGENHWETTHMKLNFSGKILMIKSISFHSTEEWTDFQPVPNQGYQAAIALLESLPLK